MMRGPSVVVVYINSRLSLPSYLYLKFVKGINFNGYLRMNDNYKLVLKSYKVKDKTNCYPYLHFFYNKVEL